MWLLPNKSKFPFFVSTRNLHRTASIEKQNQMKTLSSSISSSLLVLTAISLFLLGLSRKCMSAADDTNEADTYMTFTYQQNASGLNFIRLQCPQDGNNNYSRNMCKIIEESMDTYTCSWSTSSADEQVYAFSDVYDRWEGPYFRPSSGSDYMDIYNCDGTGDESTSYDMLGMVTVTCDEACTCETGSHTDKHSYSVSHSTELDGESCALLSAQPGHVGPVGTFWQPTVIFGSSSLAPDEHIQVICTGEEEELQMAARCEIPGGTFASMVGWKRSSEIWNFSYFDCVEDDCWMKCPMVCNDCTVVANDGSSIRDCNYYAYEPYAFETSGTSSSFVVMWIFLVAVAVSAAISRLPWFTRARNHDDNDVYTSINHSSLT